MRSKRSWPAGTRTPASLIPIQDTAINSALTDVFRTLHLEPAAIAFGTDGWRGVLGVDITIERLLPVAAAAAASSPIPHRQSSTAARW